MLLFCVGGSTHTLRKTLIGKHNISSSFTYSGKGTGQMGDRVKRGTFYCYTITFIFQFVNHVNIP